MVTIKTICEEITNCDNLPTNTWLLKARHVEMPDKVFVERYWPGQDCERAEYRKVKKCRWENNHGWYCECGARVRGHRRTCHECGAVMEYEKREDAPKAVLD